MYKYLYYFLFNKKSLNQTFAKLSQKCKMSFSLMKMKCYTSLHKIFIIFTCVEIKFIAKVHLCSVWPHKVCNNSINLVCNVLCFVSYCSFEVHYGIWYQKSSSAMNRNIIITINCWFKNWPQILVFATIYLEQNK